MVEILIKNIRVRRIRSGYATYIDKRNLGIGDGLLAPIRSK